MTTVPPAEALEHGRRVVVKVLRPAFTLAGFHDEAVTWVGRAVDGQFWNWRLSSEHDPLLAPLRDREDLRPSVARARSEFERLSMRRGVPRRRGPEG